MKTILLPTDFSENSKNAIEYALTFFQGQSNTFVFLNIQKTSEFTMDDFYSNSPQNSIHKSILADNKHQLASFAEPLVKKYELEEDKFKLLVDFDVFTDSINQAIDKHKIDLIVMGTNGATGAKEVVLGSNTINVIRKATAPVLTIPEDYKYQKLESVLFSTHNCSDFSNNGIKVFIDLLLMKESKLRVLQIWDTFQKFKQGTTNGLDSIFEELEYDLYRLTEFDMPAAIDAFIQLHPVDMHAMFVEHETFLSRFVHGSDTKKISKHTKVPLLILRK